MTLYVRTVRKGCPAYIHVYRACDAHLALFGMSCILILPGFWIHASPSTCTATGSVNRIVIYRARRGRQESSYVRTYKRTWKRRMKDSGSGKDTDMVKHNFCGGGGRWKHCIQEIQTWWAHIVITTLTSDPWARRSPLLIPPWTWAYTIQYNRLDVYQVIHITQALRLWVLCAATISPHEQYSGSPHCFLPYAWHQTIRLLPTCHHCMKLVWTELNGEWNRLRLAMS